MTRRKILKQHLTTTSLVLHKYILATWPYDRLGEVINVQNCHNGNKGTIINITKPDLHLQCTFYVKNLYGNRFTYSLCMSKPCTCLTQDTWDLPVQSDRLGYMNRTCDSAYCVCISTPAAANQ